MADTARGLERLLRPKSIAVIGGEIAASVVRTLKRGGCNATLHVVSASREMVEGVATVRTVEELPQAPDAAFVAVNREASVAVIGALCAMGCGGAVIYASGFRETGAEGLRLETALARAAGDMPFLGPNCYGLLNYLDGTALWLDHHGGARCRRGVAIIGQSSNILINLSMQRRGLPIAYIVALGNQTRLDAADIIEALLADERVTAIGLHLEGISRPGELARIAAAAHERGVPLVALKSGRGDAGAASAASHTAAITGSDAVLDAWFRRVGMARMGSLTAFLEALKLLHVHGSLPAPTIVTLSCSGGEATLVADAAEGRAIALRSFTDAERQRIAPTVHPLVTIANPFDYHTFDWLRPDRLERTFEAVMRAGQALTILILDFPRDDRCPVDEWQRVLDAWKAAQGRTGAAVAVLSILGEGLPEPLATSLLGEGVVPLMGIEDGLDAVEAAAFLGVWKPTNPPIAAAVPRGETTPIDEAGAKRMLASYGVEVPDGRIVQTTGEAIEAAAGLGGPVVLKALDPALAHKSEQGAVRLGLDHPAAVEAAARDLLALAPRLLVERMVEGATAELVIGIHNDAAVGPYLAIGSGGVLVEISRDAVVLPLPASRDEIGHALQRLRLWPLLQGYRGGPATDVGRIVQTIEAVQSFALDHLERLIEVEINPLIITTDRAVAVDALLRMPAIVEERICPS